MKIEGTLIAYLSNYKIKEVTPEQLQGPDALRHLSFTTSEMEHAGWVKVGTATVSVELVDQNAIVNNAVSALKATISAVRSEAAMKVTEIEGRINQLLAIEMAPAASKSLRERAEDLGFELIRDEDSSMWEWERTFNGLHSYEWFDTADDAAQDVIDRFGKK